MHRNQGPSGPSWIPEQKTEKATESALSSGLSVFCFGSALIPAKLIVGTEAAPGLPAVAVLGQQAASGSLKTANGKDAAHRHVQLKTWSQHYSPTGHLRDWMQKRFK